MKYIIKSGFSPKKRKLEGNSGKTKLLLTVLAIIWFSFQSFSQTFHAIIFADTYDTDIGESVKRDRYNMINNFDLMARANNMKLNLLDDCKGSDFNKENAEQILKGLKCGSQDIVFFYYSGHGVRAYGEPSPYPQLSFGSGDKNKIALHTVDEAIAKKNPKLRIIMADCCNSYNTNISPKDDSGGDKASVYDEPKVKYFESLFGKLSGSVIVASSKAGETSTAYRVGGAFTFSFLNELQKMVVGNNNADWKTLLERTRTATFNLAAHTPVFSVNVQIVDRPLTPMPTQPPTPIPTPPVPSLNVALSELINTKLNEEYRIDKVQPTLNTFFASASAVVQIYGRNGTLLRRETAEDFLLRIATTHNLVGFVEHEFQKAANGKYTNINFHEIYSK